MDFKKVSVDVSTKIDTSVFNEDEFKLIKTSSTSNVYPQLNLGYNIFLTHIKNELDNERYLEKLKKHEKYKHLPNAFEHNIQLKKEDFQDIMSQFTKKLELKQKISSRSFFKMWEMLKDYELINVEKNNLTTFHMAEAPGGFIQATIIYNDKYHKNPNNSKFYSISLENEHKFTNELNNQYGSKQNKRYFQFKTSAKMNGDITNIDNIKMLKKNFTGKNRANLITADGGFDPKLEETHEQESFFLIFGEILTALCTQQKGGNFVCKFIDCYTNLSIKLIYLICCFYENVHIDKPHMSRQSNSERYVIAKNFKYEETDKEYINNIDILFEIYAQINKDIYNKLNIIDIFQNIEMNYLFVNKIASGNSEIGVNQINCITNRIKYFKLPNLISQEFAEYSNIQKEATEYWIGKYVE